MLGLIHATHGLMYGVVYQIACDNWYIYNCSLQRFDVMAPQAIFQARFSNFWPYLLIKKKPNGMENPML